MADLTYIRDALNGLGPDRRVFAAVLCERRNVCAERGEHSMAAVYHALAVVIHELMDEERATMSALEQDFHNVRPLTAEELAEVWFDDEQEQS